MLCYIHEAQLHPLIDLNIHVMSVFTPPAIPCHLPWLLKQPQPWGAWWYPQSVEGMASHEVPRSLQQYQSRSTSRWCRPRSAPVEFQARWTKVKMWSRPKHRMTMNWWDKGSWQTRVSLASHAQTSNRFIKWKGSCSFELVKCSQGCQ